MKITPLLLVSAIVISTGAIAATPEEARQQRMDLAYENFHGSATQPASAGTAAAAPAAKAPAVAPAVAAAGKPTLLQRTKKAVVTGAEKVGSAVKHGAQKAGDAIGTGVAKTGEVLHKAGAKVGEKLQPK